MPKVSVIIPSYNSEKYIETTLGSVLGQTFKDIEVLVVDDGSDDRSPEIVRNHGAPVRLIHQSNSGVSTARNRGISEAIGQFICFIDSDDYWFPDKLARQLQIFDTYPDTGAVYSSFIRWESNEAGCFPPPDSFDLASFADGIDTEYSGWIYHLLLLDCWMLTSATMIRRDVFNKCGTFDVTLPCGEDWDLWLRIARDYPIIKLRKPTTLYRQHTQQTTRSPQTVDFRTRLLTQAVNKWGLCSGDGRCISRRRFLDQLAVYHAIFAKSQLRNNGKVRIAIDSFVKAWRCAPLNMKYLSYIPLALLEWRKNVKNEPSSRRSMQESGEAQ
ncbi:glycosyltransferase family 2 protein [Propionivibrio limicola]|uniref:glycosyltransferase family 2 protein n=1 Tax=Propionivibrio limicola TaxID=167645 RepID=UPI00129199D7|nr:glycosyltransferase [Propionivibrio limicola]